MYRMLIGVVGILVITGCSPLPTPSPTPRSLPTATRAPAPTSPPPTSTPIPGRPMVGQEGQLWARGLPRWHLAVDEQAMDEYVSLTNAGDARGLGRMIEQGRAFPVADETRVLVLDQKDLAMQVRVLEGPQAGKTGWVAFEHVRY